MRCKRHSSVIFPRERLESGVLLIGMVPGHGWVCGRLKRVQASVDPGKLSTEGIVLKHHWRHQRSRDSQELSAHVLGLTLQLHPSVLKPCFNLEYKINL